jgi:hypothetical protein
MLPACATVTIGKIRMPWEFEMAPVMNGRTARCRPNQQNRGRVGGSGSLPAPIAAKAELSNRL